MNNAEANLYETIRGYTLIVSFVGVFILGPFVVALVCIHNKW